MSELLRKNWYIGVVAIIFVGIAIFFAYDQNKDNVPGKKANGSDVVFSIDGHDYTADDFYDEYYRTAGPDGAYLLTQRTLLDQVVKTTEALKTEAEEMAEQMFAYYQNYYGEQTAAFFEVTMKSMGLKSLDEYCLYNLKLEKLYRDYIIENLETYYHPFVEEYQPRLVSHVLITMDDVENPTEDELKRLQTAKEAWESGTLDFAAFASQYSEDPGSVDSGGSIGYVDKSSSLVEPFLIATMALEEGQVSDWIKSQYGYHLIKVTSIKEEEIVASADFLEHILDMYPELHDKVIWAKFVEKNISFADTALEQKFKETLGVTDETEADQ